MLRRESRTRPFETYGAMIDWTQTFINLAIRSLIDKHYPRASLREKEIIFSKYLRAAQVSVHPERWTVKIVHSQGHILINIDGDIVHDSLGRI